MSSSRSLVFFAYAVVTLDSVELFIQKSQMNDAALQYLGDTVNLRPYDTFLSYLEKLPSQLKLDEGSVRGSTSLPSYRCDSVSSSYRKY